MPSPVALAVGRDGEWLLDPDDDKSSLSSAELLLDKEGSDLLSEALSDELSEDEVVVSVVASSEIVRRDFEDDAELSGVNLRVSVLCELLAERSALSKIEGE
jgi:hypothetical protein